MRLSARLIEKPWGQTAVPHALRAGRPDARIGEVCFDPPEGTELPVLIKYLFTSERLSIQVHPNDAQARERGYATGKDEMWIILAAEPHATIGLGLTREASHAELEQAVTDGSIVDLVEWRPVSRGDVIYNRAGTIHAAGAGLVILEIQQSIDLTYRLFDYGRPRALHLADGLSVSRPGRHDGANDCSVADGASRIIVSGPYFGAAWCVDGLPADIPDGADHYQLVVVEGEATIGGDPVEAGEAYLLTHLADLHLSEGSIAALSWPVGNMRADAA